MTCDETMPDDSNGFSKAESYSRDVFVRKDSSTREPPKSVHCARSIQTVLLKECPKLHRRSVVSSGISTVAARGIKLRVSNTKVVWSNINSTNLPHEKYRPRSTDTGAGAVRRAGGSALLSSH